MNSERLSAYVISATETTQTMMSLPAPHDVTHPAIVHPLVAPQRQITMLARLLALDAAGLVWQHLIENALVLLIVPAI